VGPWQAVRETATVMQEFTQRGGVRPFGVSLLMAGYDSNGRGRMHTPQPPIHLLYTPCTPPIQPLHTPYTPPIHPLCTPYTPPTPPLYTPYTPPMHATPFTPYPCHHYLVPLNRQPSPHWVSSTPVRRAPMRSLGEN